VIIHRTGQLLGWPVFLFLGDFMDTKNTSKLDTLRKKIDALKAQEKALIAKENDEARKLDTRRKIVFGGALMAHASQNAQFAAIVRRALDAALTKDIDRELLKDWLPDSLPVQVNEPEGTNKS
jgi:hypothetical protein